MPWPLYLTQLDSLHSDKEGKARSQKAYVKLLNHMINNYDVNFLDSHQMNKHYTIILKQVKWMTHGIIQQTTSILQLKEAFEANSQEE